jgi:hypothetical protein
MAAPQGRTINDCALSKNNSRGALAFVLRVVCGPSQSPDRRQPAAVLASVKDKPSAALKKRRP